MNYNPCLNSNASCIDYFDRSECHCLPPLHGQFCQSGHCSSQPCQNGGLCKENYGGYNCICDGPYFGDNCEIYSPKGSCYHNICIQPSICIPGRENYKCECLDKSSYGDYCQHKNYCGDIPCSDNGTCVPFVNGFMCKCDEFFYGERCDKVHPCANEPCLNDGQCVAKGESLQCLCQSYYMGNYCQVYYGKCVSLIKFFMILHEPFQ